MGYRLPAATVYEHVELKYEPIMEQYPHPCGPLLKIIAE